MELLSLSGGFNPMMMGMGGAPMGGMGGMGGPPPMGPPMGGGYGGSPYGGPAGLF